MAASANVQELTVHFRSRRALDAVSLSFPPGVVGILGPNGAGKTTLLSVLATGLRVPAGRAWVGGHDLGTGAGRRAARGLIGWLPQRFDLAGGMTVLDTVAYAAWANGVDAKESADRAAAALTMVDLDDKMNERVRRLSGGQRQRLGLAASLAHQPEVLLLDEPTVGLDPQQRVRFRSSVRAAAKLRTVVLSTHLLEDVSSLCDQVAVIDQGKVLFFGSTAQLSERGSVAMSNGDQGSAAPISPIEAGYLDVLASGCNKGDS